jgi:hypothetical protein
MGEPLKLEIGDAEAALAAAPHRVDAGYTTPRHNHNAIEPHAATDRQDRNISRWNTGLDRRFRPPRIKRCAISIVLRKGRPLNRHRACDAGHDRKSAAAAGYFPGLSRPGGS